MLPRAGLYRFNYCGEPSRSYYYELLWCWQWSVVCFGMPFGVHIEYFVEEVALGNAGALYKLKDKLKYPPLWDVITIYSRGNVTR